MQKFLTPVRINFQIYDYIAIVFFYKNYFNSYFSDAALSVYWSVGLVVDTIHRTLCFSLRSAYQLVWSTYSRIANPRSADSRSVDYRSADSRTANAS